MYLLRGLRRSYKNADWRRGRLVKYSPSFRKYCSARPAHGCPQASPTIAHSGCGEAQSPQFASIGGSCSPGKRSAPGGWSARRACGLAAARRYTAPAPTALTAGATSHRQQGPPLAGLVADALSWAGLQRLAAKLPGELHVIAAAHAVKPRGVVVRVVRPGRVLRRHLVEQVVDR